MKTRTHTPLPAPSTTRGRQRRCHASRFAQRGQVAMSLILTVIVGLVAIGVLGVVLLGRGVDDKTQAQTAADAAALAGAEDVIGSVGSLLGSLTGKDLGGFGCNQGRGAARAYAERNDAELTDYCFNMGTGEISAAVRLTRNVSSEIGPAEAEAVATTGLDLADCRWEDDEVEETLPPGGGTGPGAPDDTLPPGGGTGPGAPGDPSASPSPPPPPPDIPTTLTCGGLTLRYLIDGTTGQLRLISDLDLDDLTPHLVR